MAKGIDVKDTELSKLSPEEIQRALALLKREKEYKAKVAKGEVKGSRKYSELSSEEKAKRAEYARRMSAYKTLRAKKFMDLVKQGKVADVTDEEVRAALGKKFGE